MNANSLDFVPLGIVTLAAVAFVLLAWTLPQWLARRQSAKAIALRTQIVADLQALSDRQKQLRHEARFYPSSAPPPYDLPAQKLQTTLMALAAIHDHLRNVVDATSEGLPAPTTGWHRIRSRVWQTPIFWWRRRKLLETSQSQLQDLRVLTARAEFVLRELRSKPLETARQARAIQQQVMQAEKLLTTLQDSGVHGTTIEAAVTDLDRHKAALQRLPTYLLADADSRVMRQSRPLEVAEAWQQLQDAAPEIQAYADTIADWHTQYFEVSRQVETMQQALKTVTQHLSQLHPSVDGQAIATDWQITQQRAETLMLRYVSPTLEDLNHAPEIVEITEEAQQLLGRLAAIEALRLSLEACLEENALQLEQISVQLHQLTEIGRYPLDRVPYQAELDRLSAGVRRVLQDRPTAERPCLPEELQTCLASAKVVQQQIKSFLMQLAVAREDRRRLKELMQRADKFDGEPAHVNSTTTIDWQRWAVDLHQRTRVYAPENWRSRDTSDESRPLSVATILSDADALNQRLHRWVPQYMDEPLSPETLHERVEAIEQLLTDIDIFQDRLDRITVQLQRVQETEDRARAQVTQITAALRQLDAVATEKLPPSLAEEENHWRQMRMLLKEGHELKQALSNPGEGGVDDKAEDVDAWSKDCHRTLRVWQRVLQRELNDAHALLSRRLNELWEIAPLNKEPGVQEARDIVQTLQQGAGRWGRGSGTVTAGDTSDTRIVLANGDKPEIASAIISLTEDIEEQLTMLYKLDYARAELETKVLTPLVEPVAQWQKAQEAAERAFSNLERLEATSARTWPPISCDIGSVAAQVHQVEQVLSDLHHDGQDVHQVIQTLHQIVQLYENVSAMVETRQEAYDTARERLDAALDRLEQWAADLEAYGKQHAKTPAIAAAVQARLDEIESAWTRLQGQRNRGDRLMTSDEAERMLERLWLQTHRDLLLGTGYDRIPTIAIDRR